MSQVNREKQDFLGKIVCQLIGTAKRSTLRIVHCLSSISFVYVISTIII